MITLERLLAARDDRSALQHKLLEARPGCTLLYLTVVTPGNEKRTQESMIVAAAAVEALRNTFEGEIIERDLDTGFEAFMLLDIPAVEAKRKAVSIEDKHPLGRLFDIDILPASGKPLSRSSLNLLSRRCLLCGEDARVCMRLGRHDYSELLAHIHKMVEKYVR